MAEKPLDNMDITVTIDSFDSSDYNGILRIYVIEKNSRFPLYGGQGYYKNACLWIQKSSITVPAGGTITAEVDDWSFVDATKDNVRVVAAIFSNTVADECGIADPTSGGGGDDDDDDDVILPRIRITNPYEGAVVNGTIEITGTADNPVGQVRWVIVRIDDGAWAI